MKKTIILIFSFLIFSILLSYSLVYGKWSILGNIKSPDIISKNIFLDSTELNYTVVSYDTVEDLSSFKLNSNCNISSRFLGKKENRNYYKVIFLDNKCKYQKIYLQKGEETFFDTRFSLQLFSEGDVFGLFSDLDTNMLNKIKSSLEIQIDKQLKIESNNIETRADVSIFDSLKNNRIYKELLYKKDILDRVLLSRKNKYISPIIGYDISEKKSKLPNAGRPYRSKYTDGIHHGWDVDSPFGSDIVSIDEGVVVRIVKDFSFSDLNKIKYGKDLTNEDKLKNLDLLRGNQVWIKTSKGDVVFYSHLSKISSYIKLGDLLKVNTKIGLTGISGIPDKNYSDYHLHFSVQKNPYNINKAGKYTILDYMKWDWYFKGKNEKYVTSHQGDIFEGIKNLTYEEKTIK